MFSMLPAALTALSLLAAAQADDPAAPVPHLGYHSVLPAPAGVAEQDLSWRQANEAVARFPRGHADLLKWEERAAPPAAPASAPAGRQER